MASVTPPLTKSVWSTEHPSVRSRQGKKAKRTVLIWVPLLEGKISKFSPSSMCVRVKVRSTVLWKRLIGPGRKSDGELFFQNFSSLSLSFFYSRNFQSERKRLSLSVGASSCPDAIERRAKVRWDGSGEYDQDVCSSNHFNIDHFKWQWSSPCSWVTLRKSSKVGCTFSLSTVLCAISIPHEFPHSIVQGQGAKTREGAQEKTEQSSQPSTSRGNMPSISNGGRSDKTRFSYFAPKAPVFLANEYINRWINFCDRGTKCLVRWSFELVVRMTRDWELLFVFSKYPGRHADKRWRKRDSEEHWVFQDMCVYVCSLAGWLVGWIDWEWSIILGERLCCK